MPISVFALFFGEFSLRASFIRDPQVCRSQFVVYAGTYWSESWLDGCESRPRFLCLPPHLHGSESVFSFRSYGITKMPQVWNSWPCWSTETEGREMSRKQKGGRWLQEVEKVKSRQQRERRELMFLSAVELLIFNFD